MITYWYHLSTTSSPLLKAALDTNVRLATNGYKSWFSYVHRCMKLLNIDHILYTSDIVEARLLSQKSKILVKNLASDNWTRLHAKMSDECTKLDLYCKLKKSSLMSHHLTAPLSQKISNQQSRSLGLELATCPL